MSLRPLRLVILALSASLAVWLGLLLVGPLSFAQLTLSRPLYAQAAAATPTGVVTATVATAPTPTATAPTHWITPTPPVADLFAAATLSIRLTAEATTTGTPTPWPPNWKVMTVRVLPYVPTPENQATAERLALEATARAVTTGEPVGVVFWTATPRPTTPPTATPTPTTPPTARPTNSPTPILIALTDLTPTPQPGATPRFPALLVGKLLFLADADGRRGAEAYAMNPDGSDVALLTSLEFYNRARNREQYSVDRRYRTLVKTAGNGQRQIVYQDSLYGSEQTLTHFGAGHAWDPRWSPTADIVVLVANESRNDEIWLVRKGEWPAVQLTQNEWAWDKHPSWSPDGAQIVFMSNRSGSQQLWLMDADGGNQRQLTNFPFEVWDPVWVKDTDN